ncbi:hypothetical protein F5Y12DRAFT_23280 [Xylaria sp. FL1777]|nr:hypothetical protein F5Y12DRAFT_23280 [Xylaria sp. FL1777]
MNEGNLDSGVGHDASLSSDMPNFLRDDTDLLPPESSSSAVAQDDTAEDSGPQPQRRYLSKRPHRKSRAGCKQCKRRKVKCDEAKPTCKACTLRKEQCVYPNAPPLPSTANRLPTGATNTLPLRGAREQSVELGEEAEEVESIEGTPFEQNMIPVISEPLFVPEQVADIIDMKMLWFYTAHSYHNFSVNAGRSPLIDYTLKVKVIEHAFRSPFLMETVKALSALDLRALNQPVPTQKLVSYQARAFEGYRNAIEMANPNDFPALLACSLFTIAMSSQTFRDPNGKRLFIVDWMSMWRGIGLIIELISPQAVQDSGLSALFYRPPIDMGKAAQYIPNNLLFMVTSIKDGDADYSYRKDYYELLKYLGSLYYELVEHGFGPVLDLRIITFFTFCPRPLLPLGKQLRPRILVIIAYWVCFVKLLHHPSWWMRGIEPQADQIFEELGNEWEHLLRVPKVVMKTSDMVEVARMIIDNHNWTPGELDLYNRHRDPRTKNDLKLITNEGIEIEIAEGQWRLKLNEITWDTPSLLNPDVESDPSSQKLLVGSNLLYSRGRVSTSPPISTPSPAASSEPSTPGLSPSISASKSPSP